MKIQNGVSLLLIRACTYKLFISVKGKSIVRITFKFMRRLKECIGLHRNYLTKNKKKWR
jgi:hypothetical protein